MNRPLKHLVALAVVLGAGLGLGGVGATTPAPSGDGVRAAMPAGEVIDTAPLEALPNGCSMQEAADIVTEFLDAFTRGDEAALDELFPDTGPNEDGFLQPGDFLAYGFTRDGQSTPFVLGGPGTFGTGDPTELLRHFAARHEEGERLTLRELQVIRQAPPDTIGVTFNIERTADDVPQPTLVGGKGGIYCPTGQIYNWQSSDYSGRELDPPPVSSPIVSPVDVFWLLREEGLTGISTADSHPAVRRLFPDADYVFIYTVYDRDERDAEPMTLITAGYDLTGGDAAADARLLSWKGTVVDDVAGGNVHVYQAEHIVVLFLGDDPAALTRLGKWIGAPLAA